MRVVTRRTGLTAELLRVWERRYRIVTPGRTQTGRRLYSDAEIERLRLLYRATLAGRSIGLVAKLSTPALVALLRQDGEADRARDDTPTTPNATPAREFLDDCLSAAERLDAASLEAVLRRAVVALPASEFLDAIAAALIDQVETRSRDGTLRPVHGHLTTAVVRRVLDRVTEASSTPGATPGLLVATPAGQLHELGAMLVAAAAAAEGWSVSYLGANVQAEDIAEAATAIGVRAVVLSLVDPPNDRALRHELRRLRSLLPKAVTLLAGGAAAAAYAESLDEIGAERLADLEALRVRLRAMGQKTRLARTRDR